MPPSTPPPGNRELLQHGFHHLVQHNSQIPYKQEHYEEGIHIPSNYGSPASLQDSGYVYQGHQPRYAYQRQHQDSSLGIQYDGYSQEYQGSVHQDHYSTPATSPRTPSVNEMLRTRSGLRVQRSLQNLKPMPEGRPRVDKSPKLKKVKRDKIKADKRVGKLERPLSELTAHLTHIPVVDIEAYVNRPAEVRQREVEEGKVPGKVKRPMNSFMLYRKAYQNRAKDWCLQNNHQVVSQVCGDSWPLEPDDIKDQYSEWARIERINHQNAHPGYKFSPTKPSAAKGNAKRGRRSEEPMSEESDLDDFEWQSGSTRRPPKRHRHTTPSVDRPVVYPTTRSAYQYSSRENSMDPNYGAYNKSSYQATNPGRPLPAQYNQADLKAGEYYQQTIQNNPSLVGVQDILMKRAAAPGMHPYVGLPGGHEYDMMHQYPQYVTPQPEQKIDPSLLAQDQVLYDSVNYGGPIQGEVYFDGMPNSDPHWQQAPYMAAEQDPFMPFIDPELNHDGLQIQDPHMHVLRGNQEGWHVESLDTGGEFDKWMEEE